MVQWYHIMKRAAFFKQRIPQYVWWVLVVVLMLIVWLQIRGVYERYTIEREMSERRIEAETELQALQQQKLDLQTRVQYMSDERGLEEELRQNFDVALPGERVYVLTGETDPDTAAAELEATTTEVSSPWYRFW